MASVTIAYMRDILAQKYSRSFVNRKTDAEIASIYQRLLNKKDKQ